MKRQKRAGTKPELAVRAVLRAMGVRYRLHPADLPGSPDLANKSMKWAIFVHGCFWHQHPGCRRATVPANNREWWVDKFAKNRGRDVRKVAQLEELGYRVLIVWECEAVSPSIAPTLSSLVAATPTD